MVIRLMIFHQQVIYMYLYGFTNEVSQHFVDKLLIGGFNIFQSEWHYLKVVKTSICNEKSVLFIPRIHGNFSYSLSCDS